MSEVTSLVPRIKEWNKIRPKAEYDTQVRGFPIQVYTEVRTDEVIKCKMTSKTNMLDLLTFVKSQYVGGMSIEFFGRMANMHLYTRDGSVFMIATRAVIVRLADELRSAS